MRKISRYILKEYISFLWYIVLAFLIIFVLVDLVENVDKFIDRNVRYNLIMLYYLFYLPYIIVLTLPVSMLLATMFGLGRLVGDNEITAMKASGISLYRILTPLWMFSLFMGFMVMLFAEVVVPKTNIYRQDIKDQGNDFRFSFDQNREMDRNNVYLTNDNGCIVFARSYKSRSRIARDVIIYEPDHVTENPGKRNLYPASGLKRRIDAEYMTHENGTWILHNAVVREFIDQGEPYIHYEILPAEFMTRTPSDFARIEMKPEEMDYFQLRDYIERVKSKGGDVSEWLVDLYLKISFPFAAFVIVFFGAPMTAGSTSSGKTAAFGISLVISFIYYALINASQVLGRNGTISPLVAAWAPNCFFFLVGLVMLSRAKK